MGMTDYEIVEKFQNLKRAPYGGGEKAPHKPLLLLIVMRGYLDNHQRLFHFMEIENELTDLLQNYGMKTQGNKQSPHLPFFHLRTDGVWELQSNNSAIQKELDDLRQPSRSVFMHKDVFGGILPEIFKEIIQRPNFAVRLIKTLLELFPEYLRRKLLQRVGLDNVLNI